MEQLFNLFKTVLLAHIGTKTEEPFFHEKSKEFYELLFEAFHTISEKRQDLGLDKPADCKKAIENTYESLEKAKYILSTLIENKNSIGMDNLLRGLVDKLEMASGSAKGFIEEEEKENEDNNEESSSVNEEIDTKKTFLKKV